MSVPEGEWLRCKPWIEAALPYAGGLYSIEDIENAISAGEMIFVPAAHCAITLEVSTYPRAKVLNVISGGGEPGKAYREYCERMEPFIEDFAKQMGCKKIMHHCRPSGERIGKRLNYKHLWSVMVKEV